MQQNKMVNTLSITFLVKKKKHMSYFYLKNQRNFLANAIVSTLFCFMRTPKIFSQQIASVLCSIISYNHNGAHQISRLIHLHNCDFVPFDQNLILSALIEGIVHTFEEGESLFCDITPRQHLDLSSCNLWGCSHYLQEEEKFRLLSDKNILKAFQV